MGMKSSGKTREFVTGSKRDSSEGKPRWDLIPQDLLVHVAKWMEQGAEKYGDNNWRKGQPKREVYNSMYNHMRKYWAGWTDEDHLSAIIVNAFFLMHVDLNLSDNPDLNNLHPFE